MHMPEHVSRERLRTHATAHPHAPPPLTTTTHDHCTPPLHATMHRRTPPHTTNARHHTPLHVRCHRTPSHTPLRAAAHVGARQLENRPGSAAAAPVRHSDGGPD
eukprot:70711-Pyramimonas_sp.AAC.1